MNHSGADGRKVIQSSLSLFLIALSAWHPFGGETSVIDQKRVTETASLTLAATLPSSATLPPPSTETAALPATQTATIPSTSTPSLPPESTSTDSAPTVTISGDFVPDEILIRFRRNASKQGIETCLQTASAYIEEEIDELIAFRVHVPEGKVAEAMTRLSSCPGVRYVEPNYRAYMADTIPTDPDWNLQYGLTNIRAPQGWDLSTGSTAVTIAVLDTGVDLGHLDLVNKIVPGYDFVNNDPSAQDDNGHGTHVAGIAAAASNNALGVAGVSWGARIMPVKVLNAGGNGTFANVAAGIIWATDRGAQVINLSLGGGNPSQILEDAVNYADSRGVLLVASTGNAGSNFVLYPARYPQVIAVAATDGSNAHAGFSNYGPEVDLSAPGESVYSTWIGGYGYSSGTSMSAGFVSGLAAILRGIPGNGSPGVIAFQMESTALDLGAPGIDDFHGYGLIQMDAAIRAALPASTVTSTATATATTTSILPTLTSTTAPVSTSILPSISPPISSNPSATAVLPSPSSDLTTMSPTLVSTGTSPAVGTESAEVIALQTPVSGSVAKRQSWLLPCLGVVLILLGVLLFWLARNRSGTHRRSGRFR